MARKVSARLLDQILHTHQDGVVEEVSPLLGGGEPAPVAVVEYYHTQRDRVVAQAVDTAALKAEIPIMRVNLQKHAKNLDSMGVRILPQPSTVAIYYKDGQTKLYKGQLRNAQELLDQLQ